MPTLIQKKKEDLIYIFGLHWVPQETENMEKIFKGPHQFQFHIIQQISTTHRVWFSYHRKNPTVLINQLFSDQYQQHRSRDFDNAHINSYSTCKSATWGPPHPWITLVVEILEQFRVSPGYLQVKFWLTSTFYAGWELGNWKYFCATTLCPYNFFWHVRMMENVKKMYENIKKWTKNFLEMSLQKKSIYFDHCLPYGSDFLSFCNRIHWYIPWFIPEFTKAYVMSPKTNTPMNTYYIDKNNRSTIKWRSVWESL